MKVYLILLIVAIVATAWIQNLRFDAMLENGYIDHGCFKGNGTGAVVTGFYIAEKGRCYTNTP